MGTQQIKGIWHKGLELTPSFSSFYEWCDEKYNNHHRYSLMFRIKRVVIIPILF